MDATRLDRLVDLQLRRHSLTERAEKVSHDLICVISKMNELRLELASIQDEMVEADRTMTLEIGQAKCELDKAVVK